MREYGAARRWRALTVAVLLLATGFTLAASAQKVDQKKGVDPRVDYPGMSELGPWDDRNYKLTKEDLGVLAPNERELRDPIPVFFRVELRKANPGMPRVGIPQYPRSAFNVFEMKYGGYLVNGLLYKKAIVRNGRFVVVEEKGIAEEDFRLQTAEALTTDVKVTSPTGAAESAIKIHPTDVNKVVAGSNGPGSGQIMWYSTNGGSTWTQASALPLGSTCCDPTIDWSSNGQYVYTSTLGGCGAVCNVWVYRSSDGGATWSDLSTINGDPRREVTSANTSDKQYLHVDKFATSPRKDNIYQCWHDNNTLKFSRSTDFAHTWSAPLTMSSGTSQSGIGCDLASDKNGNVFYFWPATNGKTILTRKSTDGGATFGSVVTVANTQDGYDFAIPAMETRRAFIYASADADLSSGAFANSIYVAWTDTTAPENTSTPSSNHGRIQVAYSRDGGATWTVRTPHETADANTVDRFHPWLGVGPDGKVYVMFYDTRRSATRVGVDVFYSVSSDGGNTWPTPVRLTSVLSPQIDTGFEWGDYNGLDIVGSQLITIFTDNRNEGGGTADSVDVYASGLTVGGGPGNTPPTVTITAPANGTSVAQGTSVTFSGTATDPEDGTISGSLTWTSSINGNIGSGASFSTSTLSVGTHTITASVTDSGGAPGSASISLTVTGVGPTTVTFYSVGSQDGRIWESGENTNVGGGGNSTDNLTTSIRVGDTNVDEQYKNIVSFNTSSIPDGATIQSATLRLVRGTISGTSPFSTHGPCVADIHSSGFGGSTAFAFSDWEAAATATSVVTLSSPASNGSPSSGTLSAAGLAAISKTGTTQLRVYCTLDDDDDLVFDYIGFYSGENATAANRPQLIVTYQ